MGITLLRQWYRFLRDLKGKFVIASWLYSLLCGGLSFLSQVAYQTFLADNSQQFIWGSIPSLLAMESQNPLLLPNCRFLLIRQIRLQTSQVVNCVTWPNILDVLSARGLMPSGAYPQFINKNSLWMSLWHKTCISQSIHKVFTLEMWLLLREGRTGEWTLGFSD